MLDVRRLGEKMNKKTDDFIVGSKVSDGLDKNTTYEFLRRKCQSINQLDIATGYFEFSALNYLGTEVWSGIDKIRILIGNGASAGARNEIVELEDIVKSITDDAGTDPKELESGKAIYRAFKENRIKFRISEHKNLFHPKLYLIQPRSESFDSKIALVGSSNFSYGGISNNVELNACIEEEAKVNKLQLWFDHAWEQGKPVTKLIEDRIPPEWTSTKWDPYPIFVKAMAKFFGSNQTLDSTWYEKDKSKAEKNLHLYSQMWPILDEYQKEAFQDLSNYAENWNGAFLCDGVGLGKTYTGLMLIEKFALKDSKRVLLISPKSVHDSVWVDKLETMLKHVPKDKIKAIKTTDLTNFDEDEIASFKDVEMIIIDEAHHFRNKKSQRYKRLEKIIKTGMKKQVFFLTATPLNNDVYDLYNMISLFIESGDSTFKNIGIHSLKGHFDGLKRDVEGGKTLGENKIIREVIVQRSRSYVKESMKIEKRDSVFPDPTPPKSITFKPSKNYLLLLRELEKAFKDNEKKGKECLLNFSIYNPYDYYIGAEEDQDDTNRGSVVGLMGSGLLKRLESSTKSFHISCYKLLIKNLSWLEKFAPAKNSKKILNDWKNQNSEALTNPSPTRFGEDEDDSDSLDFEYNDFKRKVWPKKDWNLKGIVKDTYEDINVIAKLISATTAINSKEDEKIGALVEVLNSKNMSVSGKVIIFTEFVSTAEFLKMELDRRIEGKVISVIHSNTSEDRKNVVKRFSPYYNGSSPQQLACACDGNGYDANGKAHPAGCQPEEEIDILISTDVLAEGLNLQDSVKLINFDIHWNPVKLMQRIGRIDRRLNSDIEKQIMDNHPERKADRGKIAYWNCLPPQKLEDLIGLQKIVEQKYKIIATLLGIEGGFGLTKSQNLKQLHDLYTNADFSFGSSNLVDSLDSIRLEYNKMLQDDQSLISNPVLDGFDGDSPHSDKKGSGKYAFFCYLIPQKFDGKWKNEKGEYVKGECKWYLYDFDNPSQILHERYEMKKIFEVIKSVPKEKRVTNISAKELKTAEHSIQQYIDQSILKNRQVPLKPRLQCSMTIGGGN